MKNILRKAALVTLLGVAAVTAGPQSASADNSATNDTISQLYAWKGNTLQVWMKTAKHVCSATAFPTRFIVTSANLNAAGGGFKDLLFAAFLSGKTAKLDYVCNGTTAEITAVRVF